MPDTDFVTRVEYDKRHDELSEQIRVQVARLDARIDKTESSDKLIEAKMDARFEKLSDKIDSSNQLLSMQITGVKDDVNRNTQAMLKSNQAALWRVLGWIVSFILGGGGVITALQAFHLLK